ncbi:bromodomain-containing protein DDB_G0280777 [Drosophila ficusphila]|uniref:bromodomain-containing protein DDB_G0280777 n=1 Tax=Drosophila ficusphila TaxID=30025 RepID=UPI0007E7EC15|nr:bromodomain-containing protein DDB_G0280777 [Drosophila ficusphila]
MSHLMPRRTSEFRGDVLEGTADKRQTRAGKRSAATHTPLSNQATTRRTSASRLPQPLNLERDRASQMGVTPKRVHRFLPSTAERAVPLHSDKKWVAERAQQILEYLNSVDHSEAPTGIISDLFSRPGGLRHMTIKQFVAILNFLFHNIWRNRPTVGQNHVEDITSAMQKLQYPYQVNKSWLVSPTTQHSFGHVIVLLDFLMDFAPPLSSSDELEEEFPFMETTEQPSSYLNSMHCESMAVMSTTQMPPVQLDEAVNALLFIESSKCIALWDQELANEEAKLQAMTSDKVINKKCNLPDRQALNKEIGNLKAKLQQLEKLEKLNKERDQLAQQLTATQAELNQKLKQSDQLFIKTEAKQAEIKELRKYEQRLEQTVNSQQYSVQQLKTLQMKCSDMENYAKAYNRQVKEVSELELHQQVMLSRAKQKQLDAVEVFNSQVRQLSMDSAIRVLMKDSGGQQLDLTLPLNPTQKDIAERVQCLKLLGNLLQEQCQQQRQQNLERRQKLERQKAKLDSDTIELDTEIASLESQLRAQKHRFANLEEGYRTKREMKLQHLQQLIEDQYAQVAQLQELERRHDQAEEQFKANEQRNEDLLTAAEKYQQQDHQARCARLDDYEKTLAEATQKLQLFEARLAASRAALADSEQLVEATQPPSFEPVLEAIEKRVD